MCTASVCSVKSNENQGAIIFAHTVSERIAMPDEYETITGTSVHTSISSTLVHTVATSSHCNA